MIKQFYLTYKWDPNRYYHFLAQSAGAAEYTDYISAEGKNFLNEYPEYDTKQSDGEAPAKLELWGMQGTPSLPSLLGPLWPGVRHLIESYLWVK